MKFLLDSEILTHTLLGVVGWSLLALVTYLIPLEKYFVNSSRKELHDIRNRIISIVHGLVCIVLGGYDVFYNNGYIGQENTPFQVLVTVNSVSYFIYDFIACAMLGLMDISLVLHHSMCVGGFSSCLYYGKSAMESIVGLYLSEISNPSMHLRIILRNLGLRHTKLYNRLEMSYIGLYIYGRLYIGAPHIFKTAISENSVMGVRIFATMIELQSIYFMYQMIFIVKQRYEEYKDRKEKKVVLYWCSHNKDAERLSYFKENKKIKIF